MNLKTGIVKVLGDEYSYTHKQFEMKCRYKDKPETLIITSTIIDFDKCIVNKSK